MSLPDWQLLRTFLAALDAGSLAGAARALDLTQPTAGRHIEALEAELGGELFMRSPRGLTPTALALDLQPYAERVASTVEAMVRAAGTSRTEVRGRVRISASEVMGVEILPPILERLMAEHPGLELELSLSNQVEDLLQRDADIAVRMVRPEQASLVVKRLGTIPLGLYATAGYLARRGHPTTVADLKGHALVGPDRETPDVRAMRRRIPALRDLGPFTVATDNQVAQLALIRAGCGIGFVQHQLTHTPPLTRVLPEVEFEMEAWLAMHESLRATPCCRAVFSYMTDRRP